MKNTTKKNSQKQIFFQLFLAVPVSLMVFLTLILLLLLGFEVAYADRVYPGIYIHDLDVSGMTLEEADQVLAEALQYAYQGQLQLTFQDQVWDVRPIDLGYHIDHSTSAQNAYKMGRRGWLPLNMIQKFRAWFSGVQLSPVVFYDERIALDYVQSIASEINRPVVEASLRLENANVVVVDGQVGREVDVSGTLSLIKPALSLMQSVDIPVIVTEQQPVIMDVGLQADLARQILSEPLRLTAPGGADGPWVIPPETLASMLVIARVEQDQAENDVYQISINKDLFNVYLSSLAPSLSVSPVNARFIFNDDTSLLEVIEPAVIGRELDVEGSKEHINRQLLAGAQEIELQFNALPPQVTDEATGEELGIIEEITQYTSYFHVFDPPRVQNIAAAAARFHGLLVAPGETFSMVQALGDISLDNGYAEAPIIFGG
jgi:vancomycin resistance protein YoaR